MGLSAISVCDHNTIAAYDRLRRACAGSPVKLVQGVEIDVYWRGAKLHLLGYGFDPENIRMLDMLNKSRYELDKVGVEMVARMQDDYPFITLDDYAAYEYPPGAGGWKALNYLRHKGITENLLDGLEFHSRYGGYVP
jgi:hypothetical protein